MVLEIKRLTHVKVLGIGYKVASCNSVPSGLGLPKLICRVKVHRSIWSMSLL